MNTKKITTEEIKSLQISSLPTHPASDPLWGGGGLSSEQVKLAFDLLPLYIINRFNSLIDDVQGLGTGSLAASIPTGIKDGHSLYQLFRDIENGNLAAYIKVNGESLSTVLARLEEKVGL